MNGLESFAASVLAYALERSFAFAIVFLVTGGLWLLMRRWMSSHAGSLWFLLPLIVLVAPVERWIPNPWKRANPLESVALRVLPATVERSFVDPTTEGFLDLSGWRTDESSSSSATVSTTETAARPESTPGPASLLLLAWILGFVLFLIRLIRSQQSVPELLETARHLDTDALSIDMTELCREANVKETLVVLESAEFESPAVWTGAFESRPLHAKRGANTAAIILPEGLVARLSTRELRWVLLHELAHLARHDHHAELIQRLLGAAFFFHPLVWASNRIARGYREMACDDAALARCPKQDRPRCARALFEVVAHAAALASSQPRATRNHRTTHAMASLFHSKQLTRRRIMRLVEMDRPLARRLRISALLPVFLASGAALAAARFPATTLQDGSDPSPRSTPASAHDSVAETRDAALLATDWLLRAQDADGGWSFAPPGLESTDRLDQLGLVAFEPYHTDIALTALALQALARRAKYEPDSVVLRKAIDRAVESLVERQDPGTGIFGKNEGTFMVGQALATEAIAKASVGRMRPGLLSCLESSVAFLEESRNPYAGWRYDSPPVGDNDSRMTGYVMLALAAAYDVEAHAGPETFAMGMFYLHEREDENTGRTNYMRGVEYAYRLAGRHKGYPAERAETPTAMHMRLRNKPGLQKASAGALDEATELLGSKTPYWSLEEGTIDYTYWWQGTEALAGSPERGAAWQRWSSDLRSVLLEKQVKNGPLKGTWPTVDAWSDPGLEVYAAATGALALYAVLDAE